MDVKSLLDQRVNNEVAYNMKKTLKNKCPIFTCFNEIKVCAHNILIIIGLIVKEIDKETQIHAHHVNILFQIHQPKSSLMKKM